MLLIIMDGFIKAASSLQGISIDQTAGEFDEPAVNISTALEPDAGVTEVTQPGMRAFNDPAVFGQAAAMSMRRLQSQA